jgi:hypothetical protein
MWSSVYVYLGIALVTTYGTLSQNYVKIFGTVERKRPFLVIEFILAVDNFRRKYVSGMSDVVQHI